MALILFAALSIIFSFLCSIWEAVLLSISPSYVNRQLQEGTHTGKQLNEFKKDIDKPLSAILTLNTIAHTVGAIGVGAQAGAMFGSKSINLMGIGVSYESIIATLMTLAILFASEIIPKTIGANNWKSLAPFTVTSVGWLMKILYPFIWMTQFITKTFKKEGIHSVFSRADLLAMTFASEESGTLHKKESRIIKNLLKLEDLNAADVMTPRSVIKMANEQITLHEFKENFISFPFSRYPVYEGQGDHITGFVLKNQILEALLAGKGEQKLIEFKREIPLITDTTPLSEIFDIFKEKQNHISVVVDRYGSLVGVLTMEDLLETILGFEITDESDSVADLQAYARKKWEDRAKGLGLLK